MRQKVEWLNKKNFEKFAKSETKKIEKLNQNKREISNKK